MTLDPTACYEAFRAHDSRFDGRVYVGVSTTGIYCRPVCAVRTPRPENCRFFTSAAAAETQGFRPCLRCRPELAPGNAQVDATARLAQAAAAHIEASLGDDLDLESVAADLGVTSRHLRRVFTAELGVAPVVYAQTLRLLLAKRLLTDTSLSVTDVALAAGFGSVRRFNALFRERYRLAPGALRRAAGPATEGNGIMSCIAYRPPLDWPRLVGFLAARAVAGVEAAEGGRYRRVVRIERATASFTGWIDVAPAPGRDALALHVDPRLVVVFPAVLARVKRAFDLACQPTEVERGLGELAAGRPGVRLPGAFDGFEVGVRAILGQQITVAAARTLAGRFARRFGEPIDTPFVGLDCAFPRPATVAAATRDEIAALGVIGRRAEAIRALALAVASGRLKLEPGADVPRALETLTALPGIGDWTAQYIAMRALSWPDAFPAGDLGVIKALGVSRPTEAVARAESWRPWRAYAVMHLWHSLEEKA